jgi:hypothetical protein
MLGEITRFSFSKITIADSKQLCKKNLAELALLLDNLFIDFDPA